MYGMDPVGARHVGALLLGEVEEGSLEELLNALRATTTFTNDHENDQNDPSSRHHHNANTHTAAHQPGMPIPELSAMIRRHHRATQAAPSPLLSVSGRYLPFLYHLISTLIAAPHNLAVVVVDAEGKFDVTRLVGCYHLGSGSTSSVLSTSSTGATTTTNEKNEKKKKRSSSSSLPASPADLAHVYVYTPRSRAREDVDAVLGQVDEYMVYGDHASRSRRWWGTVVIGGGGGDVNAGWKGWCRVERESVSGFALGISLEEALRERGRRHEVAERAGWVVGSPWGEYVFRVGR